ncbi:MAG: DUF4340 domain-containing protein [Myxococcota bacterium]|nr:DUF4340 domain-containing protein [Myxococcota bacterium]
MQKRKLLAAVLLLTLLALLAWWMEKQPAESEEESGETALFEGLTAEAIQAISLGEEGKGVRLERRDEETTTARDSTSGTTAASPAWIVVGSPERAAEARLAEAAAEALADLSYEEDFESPGDLNPFGLGPSATRVAFESTGQATRTLRIGNKTPTSPAGDLRYVLVENSDRIALVDDWSLKTLERDPLSFRDPRLLPLNMAEIMTLSVAVEGDERMAFERDERVWRFQGDRPFRAEQAWLKELLRGLTGLHASSFLASQEPVEAEIRVRLTDSDGQEASLAITRPNGDGSYRAYADGELLPPLYRASAAEVELGELAEQLTADPSSVRALELLDFNPSTVEAFVWKARGQTWNLSKSDGRWLQEDGGADNPLEAELAAVDTFLSALDELVASDYAAEDLEDLDAGVEAAIIEIKQVDGWSCALTLFTGTHQDHVRIAGEPGFREVDASVRNLLATHRPFVALPSELPP